MNLQSTVSRIAIFVIAALACGPPVITGKWEQQTKGDKNVFDFQVKNDVLTGTVAIGGKTFPIQDGKVSGPETISFKWSTVFPPEGREVQRSAEGKVSGNEITLQIKGKIVDSGQEFEETMTLKRAN